MAKKIGIAIAFAWTLFVMYVGFKFVKAILGGL